MKAFRVSTGRTLAPFGDAVGLVQVGGMSLEEAQDAALAAAGMERVDEPPTDERYLLFSDRTWFTAELLRRLEAAGPGRLIMDDDGWNAWTGGLQDTPSPGLYEIGIRDGGAPGFADLEPVSIPLDLRDLDLDPFHPSMQHAVQHPVRVGPAMAHAIDHWSHIVRVNQLVLAERMEVERVGWETSGWWSRLLRILGVLWSARSLDGWKIAAALTERGRGVRVHPTAVVEFSVLGDGVDIGPHAVVRGSILGAGAKVDTHATVNASVVGEGAKIGRYAFLNLCTVYPRAQVSTGQGYQACVFGEQCFVAWGATMLDLSFGQPIKVETEGPGSPRVDSGLHFLGACIGHRAVIGNAVRLRYGVSVPNDAMLVDSGDDLLRQWGDAPTSVPVVSRNGKAEPLE